jgi:hypothetical protein
LEEALSADLMPDPGFRSPTNFESTFCNRPQAV